MRTMTSEAGQNRNVVLVHGLWFGKWSLALLARRLRRAGFSVRCFGYSTTRRDLDSHAGALYRFARGGADRLPHFVAHSMGGLITVRMLEMNSQVPSGRVVLLGSPLGGSSVARTVSGWGAGRVLLGQAEAALITGVEAWPYERDIAMIAGTRAMGLGVFAGGSRAPGDGTVLAEESRHEALDDHIEIATTHTGLLLSAEAARQVVAFLREGRFRH